MFTVDSSPQLDKCHFNFGENKQYPYFTRTVLKNGIAGYVDYLDDKHLIKSDCFAVGMLGMKFFWMDKEFYAGQFTKQIRSKGFDIKSNTALYFKTIFDKHTDIFRGVLVRDFEKTFQNTTIHLPVTQNNQPDFKLMEHYIRIQQKLAIKSVVDYKNTELSALQNICTKFS